MWHHQSSPFLCPYPFQNLFSEDIKKYPLTSMLSHVVVPSTQQHSSLIFSMLLATNKYCYDVLKNSDSTFGKLYKRIVTLSWTFNMTTVLLVGYSEKNRRGHLCRRHFEFFTWFLVSYLRCDYKKILKWLFSGRILYLTKKL